MYVNLRFSHLDQKVDWDLEKSIDAFIDDIFFRARSLRDVRAVFEAFDSPARTLGRDIDVHKTELHGLRGTGHTEIISQYRGNISTPDPCSQPRSCYKYLGVFFYTLDVQSIVIDFLHAEINAFFASLVPRDLTATELISLVHKQLIPVLAHCLLAGPSLTTSCTKFNSPSGIIWHNLGASLTISPPKIDTWADLSLIPFQTFMRTQIFNYTMRYLNRDGPPQCTLHIRAALRARKANWLQSSFVDSAHALGGRSHGFGEWNPCRVDTLALGEAVYVEFTSGWFSGKVIDQPAPNSAALVEFDVDHSQFQISDKHQNFTTHFPPQPCPPPAPLARAPGNGPQPPCSPPNPAPSPHPLSLRCH